MGLEVQPAVFKWLQTQNLVKQGKRTTDNKIQLPDDLSMKFYDGVFIGVLVKSIIKLQPESSNYQKLDAIKQNSTPAIRLYNWNILCQMLKKLGHTIQYAQKSKILNMQPSPIIKTLEFLYKLQLNQQSQTVQAQPLKVDITEVQKKQLRDSLNILQFFVISISKNFKLSPQHTLNLFLDSNKYLAHLLVKGVKNSFEPIYALLSDISSNIDMIVVTLFCTDQRQSVKFFLDAVKPALISKQLQVVQNCLQVLNQLHDTYRKNSMSLDIVNSWMKQQGLNTIFFSIKRHPEIFNELMTTIHTFIKSQLYVFVEPVQKSLLWDNQAQKMTFLSKFFQILSKQQTQQFTNSKSFANWIKHIVKALKKSKDSKQISAVLSFMGWFWQNLQQIFQSNQNGLPNLFLAFLKSCSLSQSQIVFSQSIILMFHLMQVFGNRKNPNAPLIYKILINCFAFSGIPQRISFISINFRQAFQSIKNLPGGALVQPLLKNLQKQANQDCITLSRIIIQQNRISEDELVQLVEMLTSIIFHDVNYGQIAIEYIFDNLASMNEQMIADYCEKNMKNSLAHFYSITTNLKRKLIDLQSDYKRYGNQQNFGKGLGSFIDQIKKHKLLRNLVKFYEKCSDQSEQNKFSLQSMLFHTYIRVKNELKKQEQAKLLLPLMKLSYSDEEQLQQKIKQYEDDLKPVEIPQQGDQNQNMGSSLENKSSINRSFSQKPSTPKPVDVTSLKPSSYALKDLQKVKKKVQHLKTMEEKKQKQKDIIQQKKQLFRSILNEKRQVQFGAKSVQNLQYKCVYEWGTAKQQDPSRMYGVPNIKLINLNIEEETAFVQDVDSVLKKYRKVWRFLFFKYSTFGSRNKQQIKTQEKINMAEVWKMLKEYQCMIIKKQQSHAIVRMINETMKRRNDLQNLTYLGFQQYIFQMCNYGYGKIGFNHLSPGQKLRMFIKQLRDITASRGGNSDLFDNPQQVYFQQTQVVRQFNKRLKQNPEYILPEGYKKIKISQLYYDYQIHPANIKGFSSVYNDVFQVLDEIVSSCPTLGFHLIEPLTHKQQKNVAKPCLFQNISDKLKDHSKGYLQAKKSPPATAEKKQRQQQKFKGFKNQFHPHINFSIGIKIGLAGVNIKNRFIADEVAYWMDDMLDSIQNGNLIVQNKAKKKIDNQILKKKRASLHKMKLDQKNQADKWKRRAESVKAQTVIIQQKRKQTQKQKIQQRKLKKQAQKQKQHLQIRRKMQQYKIAKDKLDQKRKEDQYKRKQQNQKKKVQKQQYKKGVQQYFKKKKQQLQQKQVTLKKIKQEEVKSKQQEQQKKKQFMKKLHINILKNQESVLQKIEDVKKQFEQVWTSKQIQNVFLNYDIPLKLLFDLLLKYEKSKISTTSNDELSLSTLQFFALKFKVVPFMIQKNALAKIFKITGRSSQNNTGINFKAFKQILFRISVKSKQMLNSVIEKRKQKQKQMAKFLQAKQSADGNHFQVEQGSPSKMQNSINLSPKKQSLTDDYLFNAQGVTPQTLQQLIKFLNLPRDKLSMQQRYKQVIQQKNSKPKNVMIKELKSTMQQI